jgi:hypothetical protein
MAQHDYVIANGTGAAVRSDLNSALAAIVSQNSGATAPSTTYAYQWWADTTTGLLKLRNAANNGWITLFQLDGEWSTLAVENGSAAAPSIYFKDSGTDTGIYSPGTDQVAISTGGTGRLFVDSSGRVGLGTSSVNANVRLEVNGNISSNGDSSPGGAGITIGDNQSGGYKWIQSFESHPLVLNPLGNNVGIGSNAPAYAVDVAGVNASLRLDATASGNPTLRFYSNTGNVNQILFGDTGDDDVGFIQYDHGGNNLTFGINAAERFRCDSSGRFLVGTSSSVSSTALIQAYKPSGELQCVVNSGSLGNAEGVVFTANAGGRLSQFGAYKHSGITNPCSYYYLEQQNGAGQVFWVDDSGNFRLSTSGGNIGTTGGTVVGTQTSDERLKNILGPVTYGLGTLKQIEPVRYTLKSQPDIEQLGFIAQQVQPLVPQSVFDTKEHIEGEPEDAPTKLGMEYVALIPVLVNAVKELSAEVDALKAQLQAL